ncbi:single-stranded DNA-binding protein [Metamycoplasma cloacale]|uniref:Single-stranded DNA-binding protein n=1 Tax=Metamycoplasma cloacale TaxID=92401 RepID=A0A2Z4LLD3_9BACT|nr:single-stranded DNA-binding protein [Metamycoplasma cloacale]AWX42513.1 single-stranded DNA-binding protein [Metamycoplasma cloacale]VEU79141.1 single-stranded DNA-binding protein [Metamycoplasma cloacale]
MNKVILIGRLSNNPEAGMTKSQIVYSNFTVAVSRPRIASNLEPKADFIPCVAWQRNAEFVNRYLTKGSLVSVEGYIEMNNYVAQDGSNRTILRVVVDGVNSLESKATAELRKNNTQSFTIPQTKPNNSTPNLISETSLTSPIEELDDFEEWEQI